MGQRLLGVLHLSWDVNVKAELSQERSSVVRLCEARSMISHPNISVLLRDRHNVGCLKGISLCNPMNSKGVTTCDNSHPRSHYLIAGEYLCQYINIVEGGIQAMQIILLYTYF